MTPQFTPEQLDQMRAILAAQDKDSNQFGGMKEFDLNKPPKLPYRHLEYPKHVGYDKKGLLLVANSPADEEKLASRVVSKTPPEPKKPKRVKVDMAEDGQVETEE